MTLRKPSLIAMSLTLAALALVACGDDSDDSETDAAAAGSDSGLVSIQDVDGTEVLADAEGRTLYTAEVEQDGILCTDACTAFWAPAIAASDEAESAAADLGLELGVVERPDGERQLTLDGLPLYSFTEEDPGELTGDGFVDDFQGTRFEWQAAQTGESAEPEPTPSVSPY
jgi:predicted lipoprotein with Yx(FWY)xxD motif